MLTVAPDGVVAMQPVQLGPVVDGLRVVRSGLQPGDRVVISGTQMTMAGSKVQGRRGRIAPTPVASVPGGLTPTSNEATLTN